MESSGEVVNGAINVIGVLNKGIVDRSNISVEDRTVTGALDSSSTIGVVDRNNGVLDRNIGILESSMAVGDNKGELDRDNDTDIGALDRDNGTDIGILDRDNGRDISVLDSS